MNAKEYKRRRKALGSQENVAKALELHPMALSKRERGVSGIDGEAVLALRYLEDHPDLVPGDDGDS